MADLRICVWGARGSAPTPARQVSLHGGNTSCVEVSGQEDDLLIFDAGSGLFPLGQDILRRERPPKRIHIVITHLHWDHILGLPFFAPSFRQGFEVIIYSPSENSAGNGELLDFQMRCCGLPETVRAAYRARCEDIGSGLTFTVGRWQLTSQRLRHPGFDCGYRVEGDDRVLCYCTDVEPGCRGMIRQGLDPEDVRSGRVDAGMAFLDDRDLALFAFMRGADLCIQDSMFDDETYARKVGWGHSPYAFAVTMAYMAEVKRLLLFHFDPEKDDEQLLDLERRAQLLAGSFRENLSVMNAREGLALEA